MVEIFHEKKRIKVHIRTRGKGMWITDHHDYPRFAKEFLERDEDVCLKEALNIGAATHRLIETILAPVSTVTTLRKAQAILRLAGTYGPHRLEAASKRALLFEALHYRNIKNILSKNLDKKDKNEEEKQGVDSKGAYLRNPQEFCLLERRVS